MNKRHPLLLVTALTAVPLFAQCYTPSVYDQVTELTEINVLGNADAYPWISADGLRIYYINNSGLQVVHLAERAAVGDPFGPAAPALPASFPTPHGSCWLTPDELEIYFTVGAAVHHATRANTTVDFDPPQQVTMIGVVGLGVTRPTLTPDGQEMALYDGGTMKRFNRTGPNEFTAAEEILAGGYSLHPSQLDATGLHLYAAATITSGELVRVSRTALGQPFSSWCILSGAVNDGISYNTQPSPTADSSLIAFVRSDGTWDGNDLYTTAIDNVSVQELELDAGIIVLPSVTSGTTEIILPPSGPGAQRVRLFNATGALAGTWPMNGSHRITLDLSSLPAGSYRVQVEDGRGLRHAAVVVIR